LTLEVLLEADYVYLTNQQTAFHNRMLLGYTLH